MTTPTSVVLAGGGTAGHVSPLLATAQVIARRFPQARITCVGSSGGLEERLVPAAGLDLRLIPKVAFPRRPDLAAARFPVAFPRAVRQARRVLDDVAADVVVGFGGYVCPPVYVAARGRVPIVVHEGNAIPGMATKLGLRFTEHAARTFENTPLPQAEPIGMPLRAAIAGLDRDARREEARRELGLEPSSPTLLVTGGSLGAQRINDAMRGAVDALRTAGVQVLHVTGAGKGFEVPERAGSPAYLVREYEDRMDLAYAAADLVLTRAGGNMVCETSAVGLPAVFVPLPIGNGEQRLNAQGVVEAGGALLVDDADLTTDWVTEHLPALLTDEQRLAEMGRAAAGCGHRDAADRLVDIVERAMADEGAARG